MNTIESVQEFLGWCTVINIGLLTVSAIAVITLRSTISAIHGKMFKLDEHELSRLYFQYLAQFKILVIIFNIVPYIALKLMA